MEGIFENRCRENKVQMSLGWWNERSFKVIVRGSRSIKTI